MADFTYIPIGIGAAPDDGNGTPARTAASASINAGFEALYANVTVNVALKTFNMDGMLRATNTTLSQSAIESVQGVSQYQSMLVEHTHATDPIGLIVFFTGGAPNDSSQYFYNGRDTVGSKIFCYSNGNFANLNGVYGTISDKKLKTNEEPARSFLDDFMKLEYKTYQLKEHIEQYGENCNRRLGLFAQDVFKIFPSCTSTSPDMEMVILEEAVDEVKNKDGKIVTEAKPAVVENRPIINKETGEPEVTKSIKSSIIEGPIMAKVLQEVIIRLIAAEDEIKVLKGQ